jgi:hypothetical protein
MSSYFDAAWALRPTLLFRRDIALANSIFSAGQFVQRAYHFRSTIRFRKKPATPGQFILIHLKIARGQNKFDWWPASSYRVSKPQTVHGSRHVYVSEYNPNILASLQDCDCIVCIRGLDRLEARVRDEAYGVHPHERFILDYENDGF